MKKDKLISEMTDKQKEKLIGKKIYVKALFADGKVSRPFEATLKKLK